MPAVASVEFKAVNAQQVTGAFRDVGSAAQSSSTQIKSASTATEGLGKGMKGSVASIGQVATAFATLSLSIVNVYRSYRDLNDAQLQVDKTTKKLHATELAIKNLKADIAKDQASQKKGGLDYSLQQAKIDKMQQDYNKHQQDGKHTSADLKLEYLQLQKAIKDGSGATGELTAKQEKLAVMEEGLTNIKTQLGESQERFNDIQQNFYLSIAPLAISTIATLATTFGTLKTAIGGAGAGGIIGSLGGLGLILGGLSLGVIAYQNNWLGLKDKIGGVITWVKDRIGLWKQGFEDVFNLVKKGDWNGAFQRIGVAAQKFWEDLKRTVPFFGGVESVVNKIKNGNWKGALLEIWVAAKSVWETIKKNIPFLGDIEKFILALSQGKWSVAFDAIKKGITDSGIPAAIEKIFGKDWITNVTTRIQSIPEILKTSASLAKAAAEKGDWKGVGVAVSTGISEGLKASGGQDVIDKMLNFGIGPAAILQAWKDPKQRKNWYEIGQATIKGIGEAFNATASFLDPYIAKLLDPATWIAAINTAGASLVKIGQGIWNFIFSEKSISQGITGVDFGAAGQGILDGINKWLTEKMPTTKIQLDKLAEAFQRGVQNASIGWQNVGIAIWNQIVEGMKKNPVTANFAGAFDFLKAKPIELPVTPTTDQSLIDKWSGNLKPSNPVKVPTSADPTVFNQQLSKVRVDVGKKPATLTVNANTKAAQQAALQLVNKINGMHATVQVSANTRFSAGAHFAGGYSGTVRQPTVFTAGEGGREEHVSVTPIGSTGHSGDSGGGFNGTINVYVDGVLRPARYDMGARK